ncbi:MAG: sensor histidine kinase [Deferribacterales bacterium]
MPSSATSDLMDLLESVLNCRVMGLIVRDTVGVLLRTGETSIMIPEYSIVSRDVAVSIFTDRPINPSEDELTRIKKLLNVYVYSPTDSATSREVASAKILENITGQRSLDKVLHQLVSSLILNGDFRRAGIMFLNEALLELRGVIYCNESMKIDVTAFRNTKLIFKSKNILSDIMFYDRTEIIQADTIEGFENFEKYFCGNMLVTGLGVGKKPIGVLIVCKDDYSKADTEAVKLYGNICSLSIEFFRTRKQLELVQTQLEDMKKTNSNKENLLKMGSLSATVAHELKNPLVAIGGFAKRMEQTEISPQAKNYLKIIQSEIVRLEKIVKDILSYSRRMEVDKHKVNLKELLDEVMVILRNCLCFGLINVVVKISDELYVYVDRDKFMQVLMNLITNSVQEMQDGGDVIIDAKVSKKHITLTIKDTGGGIPTDVMEKIFEPFFTKKRNGTGLGLPLCKKIMLAHGGDIFVSDSGKGAVFTLVLPA